MPDTINFRDKGLESCESLKITFEKELLKIKYIAFAESADRVWCGKVDWRERHSIGGQKSVRLQWRTLSESAGDPFRLMAAISDELCSPRNMVIG